jgi:hypothetical protein
MQKKRIFVDNHFIKTKPKKNDPMKIITSLFITLLLSPFFGFSQSSCTTFDELMMALKTGKEVRIVAEYGKLTLFEDGKQKEKSIDAVGGMIVTNWEYFAEGVVRNKLAFVTFSANNLIKNPLGKGYVINYVKFRISADGKVKIIAQYLNPKNFKVKMDESFEGEIGKGIGIFAN